MFISYFRIENESKLLQNEELRAKIENSELQISEITML